MPTTSHKKGAGHYAKKKYSFASVRAHVTDAMKFKPEQGAIGALEGIRNSARALEKKLAAECDDDPLCDEKFLELRTWESVLDNVLEAIETLKSGPPPDEDDDDEDDE